MNKASNDELRRIAQVLVQDKGILAADESLGTIQKRFDQIGVESTEDSRRCYRELLFSTPGAEAFISGVILFDETLRDAASDGSSFVHLLRAKGIIPGIKVDKGLRELPLAAGEKITEGLDGLRERLIEYRALGARFAKWRTVYSLGPDRPSDFCIEANAHVQAYYAALCIEEGLVPIVEPEVLMDGDHSIKECYEATTSVLSRVFFRLAQYGVPFSEMLLKTNMVLSGSGAERRAGTEEVAEQTLRCMSDVLPPDLPGVVFLSGGQTEKEATLHLSAMNARGGDLPWKLSFSYGRALQASALTAWRGKLENGPHLQDAFLHRAKLNGAALKGGYVPEMEAANRPTATG